MAVRLLPDLETPHPHTCSSIDVQSSSEGRIEPPLSPIARSLHE